MASYGRTEHRNRYARSILKLLDCPPPDCCRSMSGLPSWFLYNFGVLALRIYLDTCQMALVPGQLPFRPCLLRFCRIIPDILIPCYHYVPC